MENKNNNKIKIQHISQSIGTDKDGKDVFTALCGASSHTRHIRNDDPLCKECKESLDRIWMDND
jgi:hypothetical protein